MAKVEMILKLFTTLTFFQLAMSEKVCESGSLNRTWSNLTSIGQITKELLEADNNCRIIDLSHNLIKFDDNVNISDVLRNQNNLEIIRLNFNPHFNAGSWNQQIFNNKNLKIFECIQCGFEVIESENFVALTNLTELRLNENNIDRINVNAFAANVNLSLLDLSENNLENLPLNLFASTRRFQSLILSRNPIKIPKSSALLKSDSIKFIQLDNCNLTTIYTETFAQLVGLETLNLTGNLISILPATSFTINLNLKSLFVEDNRITTFPVSLLSTAVDRGLHELCVDKNNFEEQQTLEFEKFVKMYVDRNLRGANCQSDLSYFIEKMNIGNGTNSKDVPKRDKKPTEGISDFFIGSYITLVIICQAVAVVVLLFYYIKISKYEKFEGGVNYANTILNDDEIYKVYKFNDE